jgi:OOP family OmpA-OmpF porin
LFNLKTMNYSTLKKTVALSLVSLMAIGAAKAQTAPSDATTTPKVFGGAGQYNTWNLGVNVGLPSIILATGGSPAGFSHWTPTLGWGVTLRDQFQHAFGIELSYYGGKVEGSHNITASSPWVTDVKTGNNFTAFNTNYTQFNLSGVVNILTIDWLQRKDEINLFGTAGLGAIWWSTNTTGANTPGFATSNEHWSTGAPTVVVPLGVGVKFKLTNQWALNLGYNENFIDDYSFTGVHRYPAASHYSYGYGGAEYTFGPKSKPNLEWTNPVALMYDELYDAALRAEVAALKGRVTNVENAVNDLKKDSDGDGVSDQFDKCPNTPAGTVVDGSGCPIKFPAIDTSLFVRKGAMGMGMAAPIAYSNIQFEFDSSVLRTSSYPVLDATSADLRASGSKVELDGYASSEGTAAHNLVLSKDRATSVKTYLVNSGVDAKKIKIKAYGETHPIADNSTEEGRVLNRRVQFKK